MTPSKLVVPQIAPMTYSGLLDDVVERFPVTESVNQDFFTRAIVKNLFFSGDILINDGYLVNHPAARASLLDEQSILRVMMREGFVRILSRQPNRESFIDYPETMARSGSESFKSTVSLPEWPSIKDELRRISVLLYTRNFIQSW